LNYSYFRVDKSISGTVLIVSCSQIWQYFTIGSFFSIFKPEREEKLMEVRQKYESGSEKDDEQHNEQYNHRKCATWLQDDMVSIARLVQYVDGLGKRLQFGSQSYQDCTIAVLTSELTFSESFHGCNGCFD
jgi:hypothetical protein